VHEAIAEALHRLGVDQLFGLVGSGNFQLVRHLVEERGAAWHWARHETAAVTMADSWARVTGRVGVCSVHQGPGLTNAMTGLTEAVKAHTPLLLVAGDVATTARGVNQQIDQGALARSVGAGAAGVRAAATALDDTVRAFARASTELRPVVLSLPIDLQVETCPEGGSGFELPPDPSPTRPAREAVRRVAELIEGSERPLVLGGRGAVRAGARAPLEALAERIGALLATSAPANGLFAGNPFSLGISGGFASPVAQRLIPRSDLVLAFGASLNRWTTRTGTLIGPDTAVVQCDSDPSLMAAHRPAAEALTGDAREAAEALVEELDRRGIRRGDFRAETDPAELEGGGWELRDRSGPRGLDPEALMRALEERLPAERTVATDAGHFQGYPPMLLSVPDAQGFVFTQAFQSVGLGLATGVGAAVARPDRVCVTVVGDGGAMMSLGELDTAAAHRLPLLVVVMDDAAYGAEVHHFEELGEPTDLARFGRRDFAAVARTLGAEAATVRTLADLGGPLDGWLESPSRPLVLDCKVDPAIRAEWIEEAFKGGA